MDSGETFKFMYPSSCPHNTSFCDANSDFQKKGSHSSAIPFTPEPYAGGGDSCLSYDVAMCPASPTPSILSMTSSLRAQAFKHEFGRSFNSHSEIYRFPADDEELDRLGKQHLLFKKVMGNYPPPMYQVMKDNSPSMTKTCLDLGCGSGNWIMECARDFPHCRAVAVDLIPLQSPTMPLNCRSEVDDINLGLEHFYGDFDVVHARLISSGIKDYKSLIDDISRVLRPGGVVILVEWDYHAWDVNKERIVVSTSQLGPPWLSRWLAFTQVAIRDAGGSADISDKLHMWISEHGSFEDTVEEWFFIPNSELHLSAKDAGVNLQEDILTFLRSTRPLLLKSGVPEAIVDELQLNATNELKYPTQVRYIRLQRIYARKKRH